VIRTGHLLSGFCSGGDTLPVSGGPADGREIDFCLLSGSSENLDSVGNVLFRMVGHHLHPDPRSAFWNRGEFNKI